jgi:hypothetical protein
MKIRCLTGGPMHVSRTKRVPEGRRDRNSTMLSSPDHTGHVALLLAMSAPQDPNWARYNSATPPPARPKFCIDLAWGVTNNWKKIWPGRRGAPKAPRVHPHTERGHGTRRRRDCYSECYDVILDRYDVFHMRSTIRPSNQCCASLITGGFESPVRSSWDFIWKLAQQS